MNKPSSLLIFLIVLLFGWGTSVRADSAASFTTPASGMQPIGTDILTLEDPAGDLTLRQIQMGNYDWSLSRDTVFNEGYTASVWWLQFDIHNPRPDTDWLLEVAYAPLDHVDVYLEYPNQPMVHLALGDKLPFAERPILHRYFLVPLSLRQDESVKVYLRVQTAGSLQVPLNLWRTRDFHISDIQITAIQGLYYGGLLIIAVYNLLIYVVLRERFYLYYVGWVSSMFWFMASLNGWAFQFWWPNATHWNDLSIVTSLSLVVLFGFLFTGAFLGLPKWSRAFKYGHYSWVGICIALFVASLTLPYSLVGRIIIPFAAFGCLWGLLAGVVAMRRNATSARIYVVAWALILIGGIIMALSKIHLLPRNGLTDYAIQLGSLLEVLLLSFALAERINRERALRHEAQNQALETQRRANEELERRVQERTVELESANQRLKELSDTDQLTGLKNRRYLNLHVEQEFARAQRYQHYFAVLMIDVDHFKSINDNYGHPVGDDCLQEVAQRIRAEMGRPGDTASRYGGEEFCVVLPETEPEGAYTVAERIRHKIEASPLPTRNQRLSLTVSIGVHVAIPAQDCRTADFIAQADAALYEAKQSGRNRVVLSSDLQPNSSAGT